LIFADNWGSKSSLSLEHQGIGRLMTVFGCYFSILKQGIALDYKTISRKNPEEEEEERKKASKRKCRDSFLLEMPHQTSPKSSQTTLHFSHLNPIKPSQNQPTITKTRVFQPKLFMGFSRSSFCPFYQTPISGFQPKVSQNAKLASLYVGLREVALASNLLILWYCCCLVFEKT